MCKSSIFAIILLGISFIWMVAQTERQSGLSLLVTCKQTGSDSVVQLVEVCPDCGFPSVVTMSNKSITSERSRAKTKSQNDPSSRESSVDSESDSQIGADAINECSVLTPIETWTESEHSKLSAPNKKLANNIEIIMSNITSIRDTVNSIVQEHNSMIKYVKKNADRVRDIDYEHGHYVGKVGDLQRAVGLLQNESNAIKGELSKKDSDIDEIERQVKRKNLLISGVAEDSGETVLLGDLNWDCTESNEYITELSDSLGLEQLISGPTRFSSTRSSLLDVILTNIKNVYQQGSVICNLSDHLPVFVIKKRITEPSVYENIYKRSFRQYDSTDFMDRLCDLDWTVINELEDVDLAWNMLYLGILCEANKLCPFKNFKVKKNRPVWYNGVLCSLGRERDILLRNYRRTGSTNMLLFGELVNKRKELGRSKKLRVNFIIIR